MPERAEFHPLAVRAVSWLLALLTPRLRSDATAAAAGVVVQRADLVARQRGARIAIECTQRLSNHSAAPIQFDCAMPQPFGVSARLAPQQSMELVSRHAYVLSSRVERPASGLLVSIDAALPIGTYTAHRTNRRGSAVSLTVAGRAGDQAQRQVLRGVLARLLRHASAGVVFHSAAGDRAVFRGTVAGCAVRLRFELCG
jgi:hypothetical protein